MWADQEIAHAKSQLSSDLPRAIVLSIVHRKDVYGASRGRLLRNARIMAQRFGLDGKGERTLQEIADEHGLSRERVRNIIDNGLRRMRHPRTRHLSVYVGVI